MGTHLHINRRGLMAAGAAGAMMPLAPAPVAMAQTSGPDDNSRFVHLPPKDQAPETESFVDIPGARLYARDTGGAGAPIVLMHPASGSAMVWSYQQPVFAKAGHRVIAYSRRGYAKSSAFDKSNPGSGSQDLFELARALNLPRFHLVASAAGGSISMDFALSHPDMLLSLTISSNSAGVRDGAIFRAAEQIRPVGWDKMPVDFRELGPSYRAANAEGTKLWLELEHHSLVGTEYRQTPTNRVTDASLRNVKPPVLLISGAADLITPPAITRLLRDAIPRSEMIVAEETGHSVYWEQPDVFNKAVLDFIARQRG
ncbi:MAG: Twin-arginine translocation pathway signal [Hyphomicrobiales bacterium]|jgi:pimeloyl-ACP methyl ester carboxylesterase|nr:Twin-arginine translocation pathway signal [Hyphomicrobiales bacterium]